MEFERSVATEISLCGTLQLRPTSDIDRDCAAQGPSSPLASGTKLPEMFLVVSELCSTDIPREAILDDTSVVTPEFVLLLSYRETVPWI